MKHRKIKGRLFAIFAAIAVLVIAAFRLPANVAYAAPDSHGNDGNGWTIMLYLCGTDLETDGGYGSINIEEICNANIPDDVNFLIETGGTNQWQYEGIDSGVLGRYKVEGGALTPVETQPLASMGDVNTLVDFVNWGVSNYPSQHYGLIFWDHGGGSVDGVCYDQLHDNDRLDMPELGQAMNRMPVTLDLIGFDACLMGSLECAKMLQLAGHYMVASEETEPGYGWDYTAILNSLAENTAMKGDELGRIICDAFYNKCDKNSLADSATLAVIDLAQINLVNGAFDNFATSMAVSTQDMQAFGNVAGGVEKAESFGGNTPDEGYCNLVDIIDMVNNTSGSVTGDDKGADLIEAVKMAVLYSVHGSGRANANGLAVYYPLEVNPDVIQYYNSFSDNAPYLQYISALAGSGSSQEAPAQTDTDNQQSSDSDEDAGGAEELEE